MVRIVIIDDNSTILLITEALLKNQGFISEEDDIKTFTGIKGLSEDMIFNFVKNVDIVICDNDLGTDSIEGIDFLKKIQGYNFKGLSILMTADESYQMRSKIDNTASIEYVTKNTDSDNGAILKIGKLINDFRVNGFASV